jgi:NIMA (never in mitosis gene a)-related kinase
MEYCNRGDLQSLLKKAKDKNSLPRPSVSRPSNVTYGLKEHVTWNIALQVISGLYYLHKKKVLHRDLKAANVFLMKDEASPSPYFSVKIGDLGVAKLLETSTAFAQTIVGTP